MIRYLALSLLLVQGCTTIGTNPQSGLPRTLGEATSGYGYIPLDGLAVNQTFEADSCRQWRQFTPSKSAGATPSDIVGERAGADPFKPLLETLPDISVRFAVASFDAGGGLTFGPAKVTAKGHTYRAVLDYVNVDAIPVTFWITAFSPTGLPISLSSARGGGMQVSAYGATIKGGDAVAPYKESEVVTIPVYVGVGMRLSADVTALEAGVPLISLGAIGLEAQANRLTGTLSVQTIGVTGESIATSLPLPSKLDQTTIENGILSIGSTRAVLYRDALAGNGVVKTPRVVGIYSPIGSDPALVNAIYSELSRERPRWARPCRAV